MLTSSAITREDYAKNPQAVLDVLEFYTDHQKREYEEYGTVGAGSAAPSAAATPSRNVAEPARFAAGTGFAGAQPSGGQYGGGAQRPGLPRQDTAPGNLGAPPSAAPPVRPPQPTNTIPQATRPAPPRPLVANRAPPPAPKQNLETRQPAKDTPSRARADANARPMDRGDDGYQQQPSRPALAPSKSAPATAAPESDPVDGPAGAMVGPPPVKPLEMKAKQPQGAADGVAAAAAALEAKPKPAVTDAERRISTLSEPQIMEKLRQVVSQDDPKTLYATIKKIGQG